MGSYDTHLDDSTLTAHPPGEAEGQARAQQSVLLVMPPLTTPDAAIDKGLQILRDAVAEVLEQEGLF